MNEYSKQKLSKRNKNTAKQTNKQTGSAQHLAQIIVCFTVSLNKAISMISNQTFYRIYAKVYTYFTV